MLTLGDLDLTDEVLRELFRIGELIFDYGFYLSLDLLF
jgi:hypothetical protein